jgi:lipopolysaccharide/colanic/teichoic acid biosynthesis glycosyltransferase
MLAKRAMDVSISVLMLIVLLPLFALVAALIKLDSQGPVFFRQKRVGKAGKVFEMIKFRSMTQNAEKTGLGYEVAQDDSRITRVGGFLRKWGVDELPQLFNVLQGDVSLVGPRAARPDQVERFTETEKQRMKMKPGITGWSIVNGRNSIDWKQRIQLDLWYVEHWSLWLDVKILFITLWVVLVTRKGVYGPGGVTRDYDFTQQQEHSS